jgi:glutathione S-transferase
MEENAMSELFEFPPTRPNRAKLALLETGVDYDSRVVDLRSGEHHAPVHRQIHPLDAVPVYRSETYTMFESVAIVLQIIDEHPMAGLAPPPGSAERAAYYQWCVFACAELDPALFDVMKHTMHLPETECVSAIAERGRAEFSRRADMLSQVLEHQDYLLAGGFSGADIAIGYDCNWAEYTGLLSAHPVLAAYYARLMQRPAFQQVFDK